MNDDASASRSPQAGFSRAAGGRAAPASQDPPDKGEGLDLPIQRKWTVWDCLAEDEAVLKEVLPALGEQIRAESKCLEEMHQQRLREAFSGRRKKES